MTDRNTEIDLGVLHQAIVADIKAQFPDLATVEFYRAQDVQDSADRSRLTVPACLLELSDFEVAEDVDPGTEQLAVNAKFEAELIISFRDSNPKLAIRKLAAAFAAWLRLRKWTNPADPSRKLPTAPARVVGAYADDFSARREQFEVFRVEWQQVIHLGNTVWTNEGQTPSDVSSAFAPDIGSGNEDAYDKVSP